MTKCQKMTFLMLREEFVPNVEMRRPLVRRVLGARFALEPSLVCLLFYCWSLHIIKIRLTSFWRFFLYFLVQHYYFFLSKTHWIQHFFDINFNVFTFNISWVFFNVFLIFRNLAFWAFPWIISNLTHFYCKLFNFLT